jgi:hypothetical protein
MQMDSDLAPEPQAAGSYIIVQGSSFPLTTAGSMKPQEWETLGTTFGGS